MRTRVLGWLFIYTTWVGYAQSLTSSNLPLVIIDTQGLQIVDEPKVNVKLKILYNGSARRTNLTDAANIYDGVAGIEYRGSTSQLFPKKPYGIELRDDKGNNREVALFGFPKDEDWILFASYNEKSLMHNMLAMKLARDLGMYASRTQPVELVVNGRYEGVYIIMEKIKRVEGRVGITKMSVQDNSGDALTGGYIFKIDKTTGSSGSAGWFSKVRPAVNNPNARTQYLYEYPASDEITAQQRTYLTAKVDSAEAALNGSDFRDPARGYRRFYDGLSFVKMFLVNEVSRNVDGYRISTFFHKDRDSKGGKIKAGPVWDYDLAFANANYCDGMRYDGWSYLFGNVCASDNWQVPFHWKRMLEDPTFTSEVYDQYKRMRQGPWRTDRLHAYIDSLASVLQEAQQRNFQRWPILGTYLWPNPTPVPTTWAGEINELKVWLEYRLQWLDANIPGNITATDFEPRSSTRDEIAVFPNPFLEKTHFQIQVPRQMEVLTELFDAQGRLLQSKVVQLAAGRNEIPIAPSGGAGIYLLRVHTPDEVLRLKLIKQ